MKHNPLVLPGLLFFTIVLPLPATTHYVDQNSPAPAAPYTSWPTAATNIQDAIDAADSGDLVLVTNGLYQSDEIMSAGSLTRVEVGKPITVQSVKGPAVTAIVGAGGDVSSSPPYVRCVTLAPGAVLSGFTLTNGAAGGDPLAGGGAYAVYGPIYSVTPVLTNCVLTGNFANLGGGATSVKLVNCTLAANIASCGAGAYNCALTNCTICGNTALPYYAGTAPPGCGGGTYGCLMYNCLVVSNSAWRNGGGAYGGFLFNCTVVSNTAGTGGGVYTYSTTPLTNSILFHNSATNGPNYQAAALFSHCCTAPLPPGTGNITGDPAFLNLAAGNFHLQTNSPCINAGLNSAVAAATDLDGNPRIAGGTVDIGAYEFPNPASIISYAWLQYYGLPMDGSADFLDSDCDGMNNWQEWRTGTNPTNPVSVLRLSSISAAGAVVTVRWQSVTGITYCLERSTNLLAQPVFLPVQSNIPGAAGTVSCPDSNAPAAGQAFYRVSVQ